MQQWFTISLGHLYNFGVVAPDIHGMASFLLRQSLIRTDISGRKNFKAIVLLTTYFTRKPKTNLKLIYHTEVMRFCTMSVNEYFFKSHLAENNGIFLFIKIFITNSITYVSKKEKDDQEKGKKSTLFYASRKRA